jgi:hypothetical protein
LSNTSSAGRHHPPEQFRRHDGRERGRLQRPVLVAERGLQQARRLTLEHRARGRVDQQVEQHGTRGVRRMGQRTIRNRRSVRQRGA